MRDEQRERLNKLLDAMEPINLEQMKSIRLMNRTDQKYVTTVEGLLRLLELTQESYYVQEIDGKRIASYRTIYWDSPNTYTFFYTHQAGKLPRTKVRARTYVDSDLSFLEIKKKNNHGKTSKKRTKVASLESVINDKEGNDYLKEKTSLSFDDLIPTVGNRFHRITLVNNGKTERLTIDFDLNFDNLENGHEKSLGNIVIIELKRDGRVFSPVLAMLRTLRIKPSGFSKYCMAMCYTNQNLRLNRFKERLRRVDRISQGRQFKK